VSASTLPGLMHHAYMAGKYSADVERYLATARIERAAKREWCHLVEAARTSNRRMVDHLRSARGRA
jgi:hypothetical protein